MNHPLIGAGIHQRTASGDAFAMAEIVTVIPSHSQLGDLALLEFTTASGEALTRRLVALADLARGNGWVLYPSVAAMRAYQAALARRREDWARAAEAAE